MQTPGPGFPPSDRRPPMTSSKHPIHRTQSHTGRTYRWVAAWLSLSAIIAVLLLANSIRDYFFVSRIIATQQVRHELSQRAVALERQLRQDPTATTSAVKSLTESGAHLLWIELRGSDGTVLGQLNPPSNPLFSDEEKRTHARDHLPLYKVVPTANGEVVAEVFAIRAPGATGHAGPPQHSGPPIPMMLELAMPLSGVDPANLWPIRRNLLINCSGALALLITVLVAGLGFRSYARGKRLEEQLEIARQVQSELLPSLNQTFPGIDLSTEYTPAEQVGGDFYDVFALPNSGTALVMGDVSGKGVPAALLMGVIHGAVRSSLWSQSSAQHEAESQRLNRLLCESAARERFASMFWCYHHPADHSLSYVNAGHCSPLLVHSSEAGATISTLETGGLVLGVMPDALYQQAHIEVSPGDILVLYSDGLVEAENSAQEEYGEARLREVLTTLTPHTAEQVRSAILASLQAFCGATQLRDDLTVVVAKFQGVATLDEALTPSVTIASA